MSVDTGESGGARSKANPRRSGRSKAKDEKANSNFMADFDPATSRREKQKLNKKFTVAKNAKLNLYDSKGILLHCQLDLCDCLDDECPGCHFPCPKCRSNKCGHECRQHRKWQYETIEEEGVSEPPRINNHIEASK